MTRYACTAVNHSVNIEYGDEVLLGLGLSPEEFSAEAKFLLAAKLYELGRVTSGQAANLCGRTRVAFLADLPRVGVKVSNLGPDDSADELAFARDG